MEKLRESRLNEKAVIILISHQAKVPMKTIKLVLDALPQLRGWYCR